MQEMINKAAYEDLKAAGVEEAQAMAIEAHVPDWSRVATREDVSRLESRLIRWMVGIFLTFLTLLGGLVTLSLNIYGVLG